MQLPGPCWVFNLQYKLVRVSEIAVQDNSNRKFEAHLSRLHLKSLSLRHGKSLNATAGPPSIGINLSRTDGL